MDDSELQPLTGGIGRNIAAVARPRKKSGWQLPGESRVWDTKTVGSRESFSYYREAVCDAFMDLVPESNGARESQFSARIEHLPLGPGAINRVRASSHRVLRTKTEIARSAAECFYLNFKIKGVCHIQQATHETVLRSGDVGLFDSTVPFSLEHCPDSDLGVASFWVPRRLLLDRLPDGSPPPQATRLTDHPTLGRLIREIARTLSSETEWMAAKEAEHLFEVLLNLTAMALTGNESALEGGGRSRAQALLVKLHGIVERNLHDPNFKTDHAAKALGISRRYVHRLFEKSGTTFGQFLIERRLLGVASDLCAPSNAHLPITALAYEWGFGDLSTFSRAFKRRFACTPGEWRRRDSP